MALPNLCYLDERPVFESERLCADAFKAGGKDEEERVRLIWATEKKRKEVLNVDSGMKSIDESRLARKQAFKSMMAELKETQSKDLVEQH